MEDAPVWEPSSNSKVWIFGIIVLIFLLGSLAVFYFHALKSVRLESMDVDEVQIADDNSGVVLKGAIRIFNPSALPLQISSVTYDIILDNSIIGSGIIDPIRIPKNKRVTMPFVQSIEVISTINEMIALVGKDTIPITIKGEVSMSFVGITIKVPFREQRDIKPLLTAKLNEIITRKKRGGAAIVGDDILDAVAEFIR